MLSLLSKNSQNKNINFGSNLVLGQSATERLGKNPEELAKIKEFKEYLAKDGKNWNVQLDCDKFVSSAAELEKIIREEAGTFSYFGRDLTEKNIGKMDPKEASLVLEKLTSDPDNDVKRRAARLVGCISDQALAVGLIEKLATGQDKGVANMAVSSVEFIKDPKVVISLIEKYIQSQDPEIREVAAGAVNGINDETLREGLREKLLSNPDSSIKRGALNRIYDIKDKEKLISYFDKLSTDKDKELRKRVFGSMMDSFDMPNSKILDGVIERGLKDPDKYVRSYAAYSIPKISDQQRAKVLIEEFIKDEDHWTRENAAASIVQLKDENMVMELVEKVLQTSDVEMKKGITEGFKYLSVNKKPELQDRIIERFIKESDPELLSEIAYSVGSLTDSSRAQVLINEMLKNPSSKIREHAADGIREIKDSKIQKRLIDENIVSSDLSIRKGILSAVRYIDDAELRDASLNILSHDQDKLIQKEAKERLVEIDKERKLNNEYKLNIIEGSSKIGEKNVNKKDSQTFLEALIAAYNTIIASKTSQ